MPVSPDYGPIDFSSRTTEQEQINAAGKIYQVWSEKTKPYLFPGATPDVAGIKDALEVVVYVQLEIQDLKGKKSPVADEIESRVNMLVRSRLRALIKLLFTAGESFVDVKAAVMAAAGGVKETEDDYLKILTDMADDLGINRTPATTPGASSSSADRDPAYIDVLRKIAIFNSTLRAIITETDALPSTEEMKRILASLPDDTAKKAKTTEVETKKIDLAKRAVQALKELSSLRKDVGELLSRGLMSQAEATKARLDGLEIAYKEDLQRITKEFGRDGAKTTLEEELQSKDSLLAVLSKMETRNSAEDDDTTKGSYVREIKRRVKQIIESGTKKVGGTEVLADWEESSKNAFENLIVGCFEPLIEYKLFTDGSLSLQNVVVKDVDSVLGILQAEGTANEGEGISSDESAISFNHNLNENRLVGSVGVDQEMYKDNMGLVQKVVFVMYQLMKGNSPVGVSTDYLESLKDKYSFQKKAPYGVTTSQELVQEIISRDWKFQLPGRSTIAEAKIKDEFGKLPEEAKSVLKHLALIKASRDDIGQHASNYVMYFDGKSPKLRNIGSNAKQWSAGKLARMSYDVAKTSHRGTSLVGFAFIDPTHMEGENLPFGDIGEVKYRRGAKQDSYVIARNIGPEGPTEKQDRALDIYRQMKMLDATFDAEHSGYWENARSRFNGKVKHWYSDFPALFETMNRDITESNVLMADYVGARDAFASIYDAAVRSTDQSLPANTEGISLKINTYMRDIFTKYAVFTAYVGPGYELDAADPNKHLNRYTEFHPVVRAALKFIMFNLINSLPSPIYGGADEAWSMVTKGFGLGGETENQRYRRLRRHAVNVLMEQIQKYTSLGSISDRNPAKRFNTCARELATFLLEPATVDLGPNGWEPAHWLINPPHVDPAANNTTFNDRRISIFAENASQATAEDEEYNVPHVRKFNLEEPPKAPS